MALWSGRFEKGVSEFTQEFGASEKKRAITGHIAPLCGFCERAYDAGNKAKPAKEIASHSDGSHLP